MVSSAQGKVIWLYHIQPEDSADFRSTFCEEDEFFREYVGKDFLIPESEVSADARTWLENRDSRYLHTETGYLVISDERHMSMLNHPSYYAGIAQGNQLLLLPKEDTFRGWVERELRGEWEHVLSVSTRRDGHTIQLWVRIRADAQGVIVESFLQHPTANTPPIESVGTVVYDIYDGVIKGLGWTQQQFGHDPTELLLMDLFSDHSLDHE